jgi:hypothetical protein
MWKADQPMTEVFMGLTLEVLHTNKPQASKWAISE